METINRCKESSERSAPWSDEAHDRQPAPTPPEAADDLPPELVSPRLQNAFLAAMLVVALIVACLRGAL